MLASTARCGSGSKRAPTGPRSAAFFAGSDYLRFADLFAAITREEAQDLIARWVTPERTALAVIRPKGEEK